MLCPWDPDAMLMHMGCAHYVCAPASHAPRLASARIPMIVPPPVAAVAAASLAAVHQTSPNRNPVVEAAAFLAAAAAQQTSRSRLVGSLWGRSDEHDNGSAGSAPAPQQTGGGLFGSATTTAGQFVCVLGLVNCKCNRFKD